MARRRSTTASRQAIRELPEVFLDRILPRTARVGALVIADGAKEKLGDRRAETASGAEVLIADAVTVRVRRDGSLIRARVMLTGPGSYPGRWLEYGTAPHLITVSDSVREGRTAGRINKLVSEGSLVIGNNFVGASVSHPGAEPFPFLRPAFDERKDDAIAAMQQYVTTRGMRAGIAGAGDAEIDA